VALNDTAIRPSVCLSHVRMAKTGCIRHTVIRTLHAASRTHRSVWIYDHPKWPKQP